MGHEPCVMNDEGDERDEWWVMSDESGLRISEAIGDD